jgi:hypothetical protein
MKKPLQLTLFGSQILCSEYLVANESPQQAFYKITLIHNNKGFSVRKESGSNKNTLDIREWIFDDVDIAVKFYNNRIKQKLNPNRKKRRYCHILQNRKRSSAGFVSF